MKILALLLVMNMTTQSAWGKDIKNKNNNILTYKTQVIEKLIYYTRPRKGKSFAKRVSKLITKYSVQEGLDPYWTATTAYVESEFNMNSKPCVGIMQVSLPTYRKHDKHTGLNPYNLKDNIHLGCRELGRYYKKKKSLRYMWSRYNGCGPKGYYITKVFRVLEKIRNNNFHKHKKDLWKN